MTSNEFVIWLKGFVAASNNWNLTPAAWQELKDKLDKVKEYQTLTESENNQKIF